MFVRNVTTGILLALPALASATPIFVEYDTRIAADCNCEGSPYAPGDRLAGWLKIDPELAPPDRFAGMPTKQVTAQYWKRGTDFISGVGWRGVPYGNDEVSVVDDSGKFTHQAYSIWDYSNNPKGGTTILQLQLFSNDAVDDFIHGKGLAQSFDTNDLKGDVTFWGRITHELKGVRRTFALVLNRLSVTPGRCRAP